MTQNKLQRNKRKSKCNIIPNNPSNVKGVGLCILIKRSKKNRKITQYATKTNYNNKAKYS